MRLIRGLSGLECWQKPSAVTIGNFDGVHYGHQQMLSRLCEKAKQLGVPSVLITFEPLPHEFFAGDKAPPRLMGLREKLQYLSAKSDLDAVLCLPFSQSLAQLSAERFAQDILLDGLSAQYILLGDDFRFGYQRQGDLALLQNLSSHSGCQVESMFSVIIGNARVSSTRVRQALAEGNVAQATHLLGRPYCLSGRVVKGDQLGRTIGYSTANIYLRRQNLALSGVFAVQLRGIGKETLVGMANIGFRPTVNGRELRFEVNLFDFTDDIYDRYVEVDIVTKLRDEQRFDTLDSLKVQLAVDEQVARDYFASSVYLSNK